MLWLSHQGASLAPSLTLRCRGALVSPTRTALGTVVAEVESDDGHIGIGLSIGGEPAAFIIEKHLR